VLEFFHFVGAVDDLKIDAINVEDGPFKNHLYNSGTVWKRVLRETIVHGPKASTPTLVKGGDGSTRSVGRSAIIGDELICIHKRRHQIYLR
jgi:hypothetical protein